MSERTEYTTQDDGGSSIEVAGVIITWLEPEDRSYHADCFSIRLDGKPGSWSCTRAELSELAGEIALLLSETKGWE